MTTQTARMPQATPFSWYALFLRSLGRRQWFMAGILGALFAVFAVSAMAAETQKIDLEVVTVHGDRYPFRVELARNRITRVRGLMHRRSLPSDGGMLLYYGTPKRVGIWMKNTLISLDLLFVDKDGKIVKIVKRAQPQSTKEHRSRGLILAVLELLGGTAERLSINPGDRLEGWEFPSTDRKGRSRSG